MPLLIDEPTSAACRRFWDDADEVVSSRLLYVETAAALAQARASVSGFHGQVGTTSRVVMQMGKQQIELTETITRREPVDLHGIPSENVVHFDREIVGKGMWNAAHERLIQASPATTLWESENEYRFSSLPMRLVGLLMPAAFRKQSRQHMQDFKAFAEQGTDVRDAKR